MEARREEEQSMFETSYVLGTLLASTPLLAEAWRQCAGVDSSLGAGFAIERIGDVVYVSFSAVQATAAVADAISSGEFLTAAPLSSCGYGLFSPLNLVEEDGEPVMVQAAALQIFLGMHGTHQFQMLVKEIMHKTVVLSGHSMGGCLASLTTLYILSLLSCSTDSSPSSILCITFGSPLLGNAALSRAILRERWGDKFCHVVSQHDIVPRLLFCPNNSIPPQLIFHILQSSLSSFQFLKSSASQLSERDKTELRQYTLMHIGAAAADEKQSDFVKRIYSFQPFGNYMMCSREGAICLDNSVVITKMLYLTFASDSLTYVEEENQSYGDLVTEISEKLLNRKTLSIAEEAAKSNYSAGVSLALQASGLNVQDMGFIEAQECFRTCRRIGRSPNLNCADLAIKLAKITPRRAQIEWYKALCDCDKGYYDSFKYRSASKRESMVNMNRIKLAAFWDNVIDMLHSNQLPYDFNRRSKWINAAHFYQLLVEPLDIAEYYRTEMHKKKGHYLSHGRERRHAMFDRWWKEGKKDLRDRKRSKFAGLTQDSCFWARVEEVRESIEEAKRERDQVKLVKHLENLNVFECYAKELVESKEVSVDVVAARSSYSIWIEEWKNLKLEFSTGNCRMLEKNEMTGINMLA